MAKSLPDALHVVKALRQDLQQIALPPEEGGISSHEQIVYFSLVRGTRAYIEKIVHQINGCYYHGWYDGCAVMIRRLTETLIIEVFEHHRIDTQIKNPSGDFLQLQDLVSKTLSEPTWNLSRNTKRALRSLKDVGDRSAHSRRYIAQRQDIDRIKDDLRIVVQELTILARLK